MPISRYGIVDINSLEGIHMPDIRVNVPVYIEMDQDSVIWYKSIIGSMSYNWCNETIAAFIIELLNTVDSYNLDIAALKLLRRRLRDNDILDEEEPELKLELELDF